MANDQTLKGAIDGFFEALGATQPPPMAPPPTKTKRGAERVHWCPGGGLPDLVCDVYIYNPSPGRRGDYGQPMEPDEPAWAEVQAVYLNGCDIMALLSDSVLERIEQYCTPEQA
jgi:hypothetical protein